MSVRSMIALGVCGLGLLAGVLLHDAALSDRWERLASLDEEKRTLEAAASRTVIARQVADLREQARATEAVLPAEVQIGRLLSGIGRDLAQLSVSDRSLTMAEPIMLGEIQQVPLNLSFKGSFGSVFDLLDRLPRYEQAIRVQRLTISRDVRGGDQSLSVSARLVTFAEGGGEVR